MGYHSIIPYNPHVTTGPSIKGLYFPNLCIPVPLRIRKNIPRNVVLTKILSESFPLEQFPPLRTLSLCALFLIPPPTLYMTNGRQCK